MGCPTFFTVNDYDSTRFEGTGVGLALCKNIVQKYGGKIWFEAVEGSGMTFFVQM
jgi:two-component system sensor histidine kinase VicK